MVAIAILAVWLSHLLIPLSLCIGAVYLNATAKENEYPLFSPHAKSSPAIFFLGNAARNRGWKNEQCWITDSALRQHHIVYGTSGAGKTEMLLGILFNSLCWGSGLSFFDGKGTPEFFYKAYATALKFGRAEDVLVFNMMTGNSDLAIATPERVSNTASLFATGAAPFLTEMIDGMLPAAGSDPMWKDRAVSLLSACMYIAVADRDRLGQPFSPSVLRDQVKLPTVVKNAKRTDLPPVASASIQAYLTSLPGYDPKKGERQEGKALEQHGYLEMQFTKIMSTLSDTYGHIFNALKSEIDMLDVVLNNRILVLLLPSLEKSGDGAQSLGTLGMSLIRAMMAQMLGFKLQGSAMVNIENLPMRALFPFPVVYDEIGYYMPKQGTAIQAAQARSLGITAWIAAQDRTKQDQVSREETDAIIGTTRWKHALAVENKPTSDVFIEQAGEAEVAVRSGLERQNGTFFTSYKSQENISYEKRARITVNDIRDLDPGEGITLFRKNAIAMKYFYANVGIKTVTNARVHQFLEIATPSVLDLARSSAQWDEEAKRITAGMGLLAADAQDVAADVTSQVIRDIVESVRVVSQVVRDDTERMVAAVAFTALQRATRAAKAIASSGEPSQSVRVPKEVANSDTVEAFVAPQEDAEFATESYSLNDDLEPTDLGPVQEHAGMSQQAPSQEICPPQTPIAFAAALAVVDEIKAMQLANSDQKPENHENMQSPPETHENSYNKPNSIFERARALQDALEIQGYTPPGTSDLGAVVADVASAATADKSMGSEDEMEEVLRILGESAKRASKKTAEEIS